MCFKYFVISVAVFTGVFCEWCDRYHSHTPLLPLFSGVVTLDVDVLFQAEENEDFLSISRAMDEIVDDPVDCYWLIKCFVNQFNTKFGDSVPHLVSVTFSLKGKKPLTLPVKILFQSKLSLKVYY